MVFVRCGLGAGSVTAGRRDPDDVACMTAARVMYGLYSQRTMGIGSYATVRVVREISAPVA